MIFMQFLKSSDQSIPHDNTQENQFKHSIPNMCFGKYGQGLQKWSIFI